MSNYEPIKDIESVNISVFDYSIINLRKKFETALTDQLIKHDYIVQSVTVEYRPSGWYVGIFATREETADIFQNWYQVEYWSFGLCVARINHMSIIFYM